MTDKNSPESNRSSPENGGTSPEKGGISPVAGGRTRRGQMWAWVGGASLAILALLLASGWWLWPLVPPRQTVQPDSPEAWRALMGSESRPVHLAAAILLAGKGDPDGTKALLEALPTLTKEEEHVALQALLRLAARVDLDRAVIEAFLNNPESCRTGDPASVLRLIPPGQEARYLPALLMILDRATPNSRSWDGGPYEMTFWPTIRAIIASKNREALEHCRKAIQEALSSNVRGEYYRYWDWADFLLTYYAEDPAEGFRSIEKEHPRQDMRKVQGDYLSKIAQRGHHKGTLDLWLGPLPDDKPTTTGSVLEDWQRLLYGRPGSTSTLRTKLTRSIVLAWPKIPEEQKKRFSEADRARFSSLFVHFYADQPGWYQGVKPTREMLLLHLKEPSASVYSLIKRLYDHGERDLRPLLFQEALSTRDLQRERDLLWGLHYWYGGIPPEVAERAKALMQAPSSGKNEEFAKKDIARFLSEPSPKKIRPDVRLPNPPYRDSSTPWVLRRNRTEKALAQMRALRMGLSNYVVDWNVFPPGLPCLTTPVGYVDRIPPDTCAGSGPYGYSTTGMLIIDTTLSSAGPDGVRDVSLLHFLLTQVLQGAPHSGVAGTTLYVRLTPRGYEFLERFESGADILVAYHHSMFRGLKYSPSKVLVP